MAGKPNVGSDNALFRCEFIEALVRVAIAKCGKGAPCAAPADAVDMLVSHFIAPNLAPMAKVDCNAFRESRCAPPRWPCRAHLLRCADLG